ncbi:MAG: hypothetical protein ACYDEP_09430 [Acidimicrobiales bacterium]
MVPTDLEGRGQAVSAWMSWARATLGCDEGSAHYVADVAVQSLERGASPHLAAANAYRSLGVRLPPFVEIALANEEWRLNALVVELDRIGSTRSFADDVESLRDALVRQLAEVVEVRRGVGVVSGAAGVGGGLTATQSQPYLSTRLETPAGSTGQGARILGVSGAFLLVLSTLLFVAFGARRSSPTRLTAVVVLEVVMVLVGLVLRRSERTKVASSVYFVVASLILPVLLATLTLSANAERLGVSPAGALGVVALLCASLYGWLAWKLESEGYGLLASVALGVGWVSAALAVVGGRYASIPVAVLPGVYLWFDILATGDGVHGEGVTRKSSPYRRWTTVFTVASSVFALEWAGASSRLSAVCGRDGATLSHCLQTTLAPERFVLPASLGVLAVVLGTTGLRRGGWIWSRVSVVVAALAVLAANWALSWGALGSVLELLVVAWALVLWSRERGSMASFVRGLATVGAASIALVLPALAEEPKWLTVLVLLAAAGVPVVAAVDSRRDEWLFVSIVLATGALFFAIWEVVSATGAASSTTPSAIAVGVMLAPIPVAVAVAGTLFARRHGSRWSVPIYVMAALVAAVSVLLIVAERPMIAGDVTILYWVVVEFVGVESSWGPLAVVGGVVGAVGSVLIASGMRVQTGYLPLAAVAAFVVVYGLGAILSTSERSATDEGVVDSGASLRSGVRRARMPGSWHRQTGLVGIAALVPWMWADLSLERSVSSGVYAYLVAVCVLSALLAAEQRAFEGDRFFGALSVVAASLLGPGIARWLGAENPQWCVAMPAIALIALGQTMDRSRDDRKASVARGEGLSKSEDGDASLVVPDTTRAARTLSPVFSVVGFTIILTTTFVQVLVGGREYDGRIALLFIEGAVALLIGVGLQRRIPVIAGAFAIGAASMVAIAHSSAAVLVYGVAAVVAILLIAAATVLSVLNQPDSRARRAASLWRTWRY